MRSIVSIFAMLLLAACTEAEAIKTGDRTFRIEGPAMGMSSDAPNKRLAARLCPNGYRVINSESHKGGPDRVTSDVDTMTAWTIRCI
jgi:hypothetical protein